MSDTLFIPGTSYASAWGNDANTAAYSTLAAIAGTANAITATGPQQLPTLGYSQQQKFYFTPAAANTGAVTINISGTGAKAISKSGNAALATGDLAVGVVAQLVYDGTEFQLLNPQTGTVAVLAEIAAIATGRLLNVQTLTATSGTYTPTVGTTRILVKAQGAAGGSGGSGAAGAGQMSFGVPGGVGGYCESFYTSGFSGIAYTVGAGGTAGPAGSGGGAGGNTTFLGIVAGGGSAGATLAAASAGVLGPAGGGVATGGNLLNLPGASGTGIGFNATNVPQVVTPPGTNTLFGIGGSLSGGTGPAAAGSGYGATGGYAFSASTGAAQAGVAGRPGVIFVYEYS